MKKGFLVGAILGGAASLLVTSKKGKEFQEAAKRELAELKENYPEKIEEFKSKAKDILDRTFDKENQTEEKQEEPKIILVDNSKEEENQSENQEK